MGWQTLLNVGPALVVDDSEANRRLLRELHARVGLQVGEAANDPDGFSQYQRHATSIIWANVQMPGYSGAELARRIRQHESGGPRRAPIIAITASAFGDEREALIAAGCDAGVLKLFEENAFFEMLARTLNPKLRHARVNASAPAAVSVGLRRGIVRSDD